MKILSLAVLVGFLGLGTQAATIYSENFESGSYGPEWIYGVVTYSNDVARTKVGEWFVGAAPATASVETGQSGIDQGTYVFKTYADYGYAPNYTDNKWVETIIYTEHTITAGEAALGTATFAFDYKAWPVADGGIDGVSEVNVFLKVLDPGAGWATVVNETQDVFSSDINWAGGFLSADISAYEGDIMQWGISMTSQDYSPTAIATDNMQVNVIPEPSSIALLVVAAGGLWGFRRRIKG